MEGETKIETVRSASTLLENADCDRLERHIAKLDARFARGFVDQLLLELCSRYQLNCEYENCLYYLLL